ncbi:MAG: amino acid adenylation domain-containing protein [Pirellulaceae bacterium]
MPKDHCTNEARHGSDIADPLAHTIWVDARPVQQQLWLLQQMVPDVGVTNIASCLTWRGPLDPLVMQTALYDLACRHQYMRTTVEYRNERLVQVVHPPKPPRVELIDLHATPGGPTGAAFDAVLADTARTPMPIDLIPTIRTSIVRFDPQHHEVILIVNHLVSDGLSMGILCAELLQAYAARLQGELPKWTGDATVSLQQESVQFMTDDTAHPGPPVELPYDHVAPVTPGYRGQRLQFQIPADLTRRLVSFSRQYQVSPFVTWMSLVHAVVHAYSSASVLSIDFPMSGRDRRMRRCVGPFLLSATAQLHADPAISFARLVQQNAESVEVASQTARPAGTHRPQLLLDYQTALDEVPLTDDISVMPGELDNGVAFAELRVGIRRRRRCFDIHVDFDQDLFDESTARRFADHLQQVLGLVTSNPELTLSQLDIRTPGEQVQAEQVNQTCHEYDAGQSIDQQIDQCISRLAGQIAMTDEQQAVTWVELGRQIDQFASLLSSHGVQHGDRVAILVERSIDAVTAIVAALKCGAAFVPVDPSLPRPRQLQILQNADPRCVVVACHDQKEQVPAQFTTLAMNDTQAQRVDQPESHWPGRRSTPDDTAYILFTSGSTGTPKGVRVTHGNLTNFCLAMDELQEGKLSGTWMAVTNLSFDISLFELLWTLSRGFKVLIDDDPLDMDRSKTTSFADRFARHGVTHLQCTPALAQALLREPGNREAFGQLSRLFIGGDAMPATLATELARLVPGEVYNMYGPTETTIWSTAWRVEANVSVSIGRPVANTTVYVLDDLRREMPTGVTGELYIGGDGVAAGYFRDEKQTDERFVECPKRGRLFRTGDLVHRLANGDLEFKGRIDHQIKLDGHRIELGEIESCLCACPTVEQAVAVLLEGHPGDGKTLAAFVTCDNGVDHSWPDERNHLLSHLHDHLPRYMVPTYVERLDSMPLTPSGKLDRRHLMLRDVSAHPAGSDSRFGPTRPQVRDQAFIDRIRRLIADELQLEQMDRDAQLADLDVDSLQIVRLAARIERDLGIQVSMATFFQPRPLLELVVAALSNRPELVDALPTEPDDAAVREQSSMDHLARASRNFMEMSRDESLHPFARFVEPVKSELLSRAGLAKTFVRGEGCFLWDDSGERYIDFVGQYGALPFGYNPPRIWHALQHAHERRLPSVATSSLLDSAGKLAQRLLGLFPEMQHVTFCNSGAECTEIAIKLCRAATGRSEILSTRHGFHGLTTGAASATGSDEFRDGFVSDHRNYSHVAFGDADELRGMLIRRGDQIAAFIVEPVQGEAGIIVPDPEYLVQVRAICSEFDVLMVVDEIQTGLGRTGHLLASRAAGVIPDVLLLAKALGGGLVPAGAVLCRSAAYSNRFGLRHSSTFAGNALACEAGLASLDWLLDNDQSLVRHVARTGEMLKTGLRSLQQQYPDHIREVRGTGFMQAIEFDFESLEPRTGMLGFLAREQMLIHLIASHLLHVHHVRVAPSFVGRNVIRIEPPLIAGRGDCQTLLRAMNETLDVLDRNHTAALLAPMAGACAKSVTRQIDQPCEKPVESSPIPSGEISNVVGNFGFLIHLSSIDDLVRYDRSLGVFDAKQLRQLKLRLAQSTDPFVIGQAPFVSGNGRAVVGHFVMLPYTPDEMAALPVDAALKQVTLAAEIASEQGVDLIGLGGFTSIVSMGGVALPLADLPPVTSGNSLTVAATLEALHQACQLRGIPLSESTAAVVGATGQTGRALALMLSETCDRVILLGRNGDEDNTRRRLHDLASTIVAHVRSHSAVQATNSGRLYQDIRRFDCGDQRELLDKLLLDQRITIARHPVDIAQADVVVTASSATDAFIRSTHLKRGAIVIDSSRPANVSPQAICDRPDVCWVEGGIIEMKRSAPLDLFAGPYPDCTFACVAEAALWALEPRIREASAATTLDPERIRKLGHLAREHDFHVRVEFG